MFCDKKGGGGLCRALYQKLSSYSCPLPVLFMLFDIKSANYIGARTCVKKWHWVCTDTPLVTYASVPTMGCMKKKI
jgi:hypothetical protein